MSELKDAQVITEVRVRTAPQIDESTWTPLALREGQTVRGEVINGWLKYDDPRFVQYDRARNRIGALYSVINHNGIEYLRVNAPPVVVQPSPAQIPAKYLLGVHCLEYTDPVWKALEMGCRAILCMNNFATAHDASIRYPDACIMVRRYHDPAQKYSPVSFVNWLDVDSNAGRDCRDGGAFIYTFSNEGDMWGYGSPAEVERQAAWDIECANLVHQRAPAAKVALLTAAHGNPDWTNRGIVEAFNRFYAPFLNANADWCYVDIHSYTKGKRFAHHPPSDAPIIEPVWLETRNQMMYRRFQQIRPDLAHLACDLDDRVISVSSESGVEAGAGGFNWANYSDDHFREWCTEWVRLQRASIAPYRYVTLFQCSQRGDWQGYDVRRYLGTLGKLWRNDVPAGAPQSSARDLFAYAELPKGYHPPIKKFSLQ